MAVEPRKYSLEDSITKIQEESWKQAIRGNWTMSNLLLRQAEILNQIFHNRKRFQLVIDPGLDDAHFEPTP